MIPLQTLRRINQFHRQRTGRTCQYAASASHTLRLINPSSMDTFLNIIFKLNGIEHTSLFRTQSTINAFFNINMGSESGFGIILFLTVSKNKIAATPENIGVVAILTVVLNYSILFPSFTFFLDGFHLAFGDKFEICIKTTDLM